MFELIYHSIAAPNLGLEDVNDILENAREYNLKNNITGFLLCHNNEFIQILEGDEKIVKELYSKISKDNRHSDVKLIAKGVIEKRGFDAWNMGYYGFTNDEKIAVEKKLFIDNFIALSELVEKPTITKKMFWYFSKELLMK